MKIIAIISAFLSIVTGAGLYVNTASEIRTNENTAVTAVYETEKTEPAETKTPQTEKEAEITTAETVTEVQITESERPEITEPAETEECEAENTEAEVTEPAVTGSVVTENETAEIPEVTESEEPEYYEYQIVYKELLDKLRFETEGISSIEYTIHDMNHDDVPELITITGSCEADKTTTFYTIKDHSAVVVGEGFRGDHSAFYIDDRTDRIAIRSDWSGTGCVVTYDFDGVKITEADSLVNCNIMDDPEGYEEYMEKMFDLRFNGYGLAYANGSSNLVPIYGDIIELNYGSYFFTD